MARVYYWWLISSRSYSRYAVQRKKEPHLSGTCSRRRLKWVVRSSSSSRCAQTSMLIAQTILNYGSLGKHQEYIGAMNDEELRRAIEKPAQRGRWEFEPGLVDLLLHDVGHEPGALPLLSHALFETWQRRRGRMMT